MPAVLNNTDILLDLHFSVITIPSSSHMKQWKERFLMDYQTLGLSKGSHYSAM